jgi:hypothetical protein
MKAFTAALESLGKDPFSIGTIPPTPVLVDQYFNDSTGVGDEGETDARGPWNEGGDWEMVEASQLQKGVETWRTLATQESGRAVRPARQRRGDAKRSPEKAHSQSIAGMTGEVYLSTSGSFSFLHASLDGQELSLRNQVGSLRLHPGFRFLQGVLACFFRAHR